MRPDRNITKLVTCGFKYPTKVTLSEFIGNYVIQLLINSTVIWESNRMGFCF